MSAPPVPTLDVTPAQLMEVRLAIEPSAARLATAAGVDDILGLHEALREADLAEGRPARLLAALVGFHVVVARASGNPIFVAVMESFRPVMYRAMNKPAQRADWVESCRNQHEHIVRAIEDGDGDRAEEAMFRHLKGGATSG